MDALLASLVTTARLPRKIAERVRLAIHAQRAFHQPARRRRRRGRGGPGGASHHADAIQLLRISVEATGEGGELLERYASAAAAESVAERDAEPAHSGERDAAPVDRAEGAAASEAHGGRKRRRRRGGRRRGRRGAGPGAAAPAGGAPVA
jgi:poly(A) polymerase